MSRSDLFHGFHFIGTTLAKLFQVESVNEFSERQFPGLILTIGIFGESFWTQAQFPGHLNVRVGKSELFSGVDPWVELMGNSCLFCHGANRGLLGFVERNQLEGWGNQLAAMKHMLHMMLDCVSVISESCHPRFQPPSSKA